MTELGNKETFSFMFMLTFKYGISSNKHRASNNRRPLISAAPLGIHIEISTSL